VPKPLDLRSPWARAPALRHRNFRLYLVGQAGTVFGVQMLALAEVWLVLIITQDPLQVGLVSALQGLPVVAFSLLGGVVADRVSKRRILIVANLAIMVLGLLMGILALSGVVEVWHVLVLVFAVGCAIAIAWPARQAFIMELVGRPDVASAIGLFTALFHAVGFAAPIVAGLVIAAMTAATGSGVVGTGAAIVVSALACGSIVLGLLLIRDEDLILDEPDAVASRRPTMVRDIVDTFGYLRKARPTLLILLVAGSTAVMAANYAVLVPVAGREIGLGAAEVGVLMATYAVGSFAAALWIGIGGAAGPGALIGGGALLAVATLAFGLLGQPAIWPFLLFAAALGGSTMRTAANAQIQSTSPGPIRGRVMSAFFLVFEGIAPLGGLLAGSIAALGGARAAFLVGGAGAVMVVALGARSILGLRSPVAQPEAEASQPS
jgi:MFS family permease